MEQLQEQAKEVAEMMGLLANENRLLILCALLEQPMTVGALSQQLPNISMPAISQHLQKLRSGKLIKVERHGQYMQYHIKDRRLYALMALLKEQYCNN